MVGHNQGQSTTTKFSRKLAKAAMDASTKQGE